MNVKMMVALLTLIGSVQIMNAHVLKGKKSFNRKNMHVIYAYESMENWDGRTTDLSPTSSEPTTPTSDD